MINLTAFGRLLRPNDMKYDPLKHHRRSIRLKGYDYARAGAYFVTLVTHGRECILGEIVDGEMRVNLLGEIAAYYWQELPRHFARVTLDAFVVMPNHTHGIILIGMNDGDVRGAGRGGIPRKDEASAVQVAGMSRRSSADASPLPPRGTQTGSVGAIVQNFKSVTTRKINQRRGAPGAPVWQRNYYEHIIRDEASLNRIRRYIAENPLRWALDDNNPQARGGAA